MMHICIHNLTIIGSDNGLSPGLHQAIIWTIAGILLIGPLETNFSEILIQIHIFSFKIESVVCKMGTILSQPQCVNPLHAKFFCGNINIYLHFMSLLHIDLTQVLKTLPQVREGPTYSI